MPSKQRCAQIRIAAFKPKLFAELNEYFGGQRASDANLRSQLLQRDFAHEAAVKAAAVYLENFELVSREGDGYTSAPSALDDGEKMDTAREAGSAATGPSGEGLGHKAAAEVIATLGGGRVTVRVSVDAEGLKRLRKKLDMAQEMLDLDSNDRDKSQ